MFKFQPIDAVRDYYGVKVALYFAWLGFYTSMGRAGFAYILILKFYNSFFGFSYVLRYLFFLSLQKQDVTGRGRTEQFLAKLRELTIKLSLSQSMGYFYGHGRWTFV